MKWDYQEKRIGTTDALPLWIADMDFAAPPCVIEAIQKRAEHPVYGYNGVSDRLYSAAQQWIKNRYGAHAQTEWMTAIPGIVYGLYFAVEALTSVGDEVIIQPPVYPPFFQAIKNKNRKIVENPLKENNGYYTMDFEHLESIITEKTKMIFLCSPHNPVGRAWTREELERLAEICLRHQIIIVSDEIHADLIYGKKHIPIFSLSEEISKQSITFISGSKTFNIAGLYTSIAFTENETILKDFQSAIEKSGSGSINLFGVEALTAAYEGGEEWLEELLVYLHSNAEYISTFLKENIPSVKMSVPEATYLGWMDFSSLQLSDKELEHFLIHDAKVWLNMGSAFGKEGSGFARINFGCHRSTLEEALKRIETAVKMKHC